ncbi:MAG: AEC family transporter [Proteobacteria bacterium]|nr:MAG: AEC family transporter [Pseudomonadota bacterium]
MLLRIFSIVFPIFAIVAAGYLYARLKKPDITFANQLNMDVFIPALLFSVLSSKSFDIAAYQQIALAALVIIIGSGLLALPIAKLAKVPVKTFVPPMMFTNSGNMGLPLAVFAFGEQALPAAVVLFIVENGLHFTLGTYIMDHRAHWLDVLRIPMVVATLAGIAFSLSGWALPQPVNVTIEMLGQVSIPLLLFSLGVRLINVDIKDWRIGLLGAVVCPVSGLVIAWLLLQFMDLPPLQASLLLIFGALPPAVLNFIVAEKYRQEPSRVASIVMLGNLTSFISIPIVLAFALR